MRRAGSASDLGGAFDKSRNQRVLSSTILESGTATNPASRRLPVGNVINRIVGVAVVLPFLQPIADFLVKIDPDPACLPANFQFRPAGSTPVDSRP